MFIIGIAIYISSAFVTLIFLISMSCRKCDWLLRAGTEAGC